MVDFVTILTLSANYYSDSFAVNGLHEVDVAYGRGASVNHEQLPRWSHFQPLP